MVFEELELRRGSGKEKGSNSGILRNVSFSPVVVVF